MVGGVLAASGQSAIVVAVIALRFPARMELAFTSIRFPPKGLETVGRARPAVAAGCACGVPTIDVKGVGRAGRPDHRSGSGEPEADECFFHGISPRRAPTRHRFHERNLWGRRLHRREETAKRLT